MNSEPANASFGTRQCSLSAHDPADRASLDGQPVLIHGCPQSWPCLQDVRRLTCTAAACTLEVNAPRSVFCVLLPPKTPRRDSEAGLESAGRRRVLALPRPQNEA